jgi:hypothetical protein
VGARCFFFFFFFLDDINLSLGKKNWAFMIRLNAQRIILLKKIDFPILVLYQLA